MIHHRYEFHRISIIFFCFAYIFSITLYNLKKKVSHFKYIYLKHQDNMKPNQVTERRKSKILVWHYVFVMFISVTYYSLDLILLWLTFQKKSKHRKRNCLHIDTSSRNWVIVYNSSLSYKHISFVMFSTSGWNERLV